MEEKEFRERVMILQRLMYGIALRMGILPPDAADALQETLVRLWRGREGIPDDDIELKRYCVASMRNECISRLRSKRIMISLDDSPELIAGAIAEATPSVGNREGDNSSEMSGKGGCCGKTVYSAPGADTDAEYKDTLSKLEVLISTLPPGQQLALRLSSFAGLDNSEIAAATGLTESNVRQLLSRGRKKLRQLWDKFS